MNKLALLTLAASAAFIPAVAAAQHGPGVRVSHGGGNVVVRHGGPNVTVRHHGGFRHPGRHFPHRRLQRGFFVHPFWFGPQFHVQNWQMYGFAPPPRDHRWVRYYDDAYLIDHEGRVRDERYGLDWDRYGERWAMDDGIPAYYGRGDYHPDEEDYAWVESQRGWDYADQGGGYGHGGYGYGHGGYGYGHGGYGPPPGGGCQPMPMPQPCGGGYGYGYYGYGYAYPIIIETTVHTGAAATTYEVVEEVVEYERPRRRYRQRSAPPPRARPRPRPRPPAGERG